VIESLNELVLAVQIAATADGLVNATLNLADICPELEAKSQAQKAVIHCLIEWGLVF
jgi:hypothetical protein